MTKWSEHVKKHAKKHKMSYRQASMDSKCKESYRKMSKKRMSPRKMSKKRMSPRKMSKKKGSGKKRMNGFEEYVNSDYYGMLSRGSKGVVDILIEEAAKRADREEYVDGNVGDQVRQYIAKKYMDDGKHYPDVDEVAKKFIELTK